MFKTHFQTLFIASLTAVFIGYFTVWLPGPAAGLQFIGFEIGEWIKFLGVGMGRNWFYLPPITLGLILVITPLTWPKGRWQNWLMRALGTAVSLLAFPAIEAIQREPGSEWQLRLVSIAVVFGVGLFTGLIDRFPMVDSLPWWLIGFLGILGAIMPFWLYLTVRPIVSQSLGLPVGIGLGVWLNGAGHLGITAVAYANVRAKDRIRPLQTGTSIF
jgi:hypothetical protein